MVEASFNAGNGMEPFVDIGFRNDGGDGDTGAGVEFAGGILIDAEAVNVEARAHTACFTRRRRLFPSLVSA